MAEIPKFSLNQPRHDMNTFYGRLQHWSRALNPLLLLENQSSLEKKQQLLAQYKSSPSHCKVTDAELWAARLAVENCIHPTAKEVIHPLFRMSMFLPMNYLIVPAMMSPTTLSSFYLTAGTQWFNQSYNSAVNYANRSSDKQPLSEVAKAYTATVVVACGGSMGASAWLQRLPVGSLKATMIRATVPFLAVAFAAGVNLAFMRQNEWKPSGSGLQVKDEDGTVRGSSVMAGRDSLYKCCTARVLWNMPCMVLPILCAIPLRTYLPIARRNPYMTEVLLQITGLTIGVPPALAIFNINQTIPVSKMEPKFRHLKRKNGSPVLHMSYYKGL